MSRLTPEGAVKVKVKALLCAHKVYWYMPSAATYGKSGFPDILCCVNGYFLTVECKAGHNKPTALQEREMDNIRKSGGIALVINEDNMDTLAMYLGFLKGKEHHGY